MSASTPLQVSGASAPDTAGGTRRRVPELLAPAGGWEQLEYAIRFGADAVYLATDRFGMRARACNFAPDDIPRVVDYAHRHGVAVHVTTNIVMHDSDLAVLPAYLEAFEAAGVDAVILGDMGACRLARIHAPHVDVHVSTQASVSNVQSALAWHDMGATRVVVARELSLEDIAHMRAQLPPQLELEAFVHGSMCMAVSGRCLISDYMTGRSAQAGHCTQPCRWSWTLQEETRTGQFFGVEEDTHGTYIMNAKDLCMLHHMDDICAAGIDSVKIEGRNKKAFYVACVVNAYRQVLDGADPVDFDHELETVSHRPYSTGFYYGPAHQTPESDAYTRTYDWVAQVVECVGAEEDEGEREGAGGSRPAGTPDNATYRVRVRCRNRFFEGDVLEVLSPHEPVRSVAVSHLQHLPEDGAPYAVDTANRTMEEYTFDATMPLQPFDMLRICRRDTPDA